jgi:hypothetical protein
MHKLFFFPSNLIKISCAEIKICGAWKESVTYGPAYFPLLLLRNGPLLPFLYLGYFLVCEDIDMEKILYFILILRPDFLLVLIRHAQMEKGN